MPAELWRQPIVSRISGPIPKVEMLWTEHKYDI